MYLCGYFASASAGGARPNGYQKNILVHLLVVGKHNVGFVAIYYLG
jgi:hypothetical protein